MTDLIKWKYLPGFREVTGDSLNDLIDAINDLYAYANGKLVSVSADYEVTPNDAISRAVIEVDASGGAVTISYFPDTATAQAVTVVKTDSSANVVTISDGVNPIDAIYTAASSGQIGGWRDVYSDGTNTKCYGMG